LPTLSLNEAYNVLALVVPGVIFIYARSQFTNGRMLTSGGAALYYFAITSIYYALMGVPIYWALHTPGTDFTKAAGWIGVLFVAPALLGGLTGWSARKEHLYQLLRRLGLNPVHPFATAWEWKFSDPPAQWMLVTLKNGRVFGTWCGEVSFLSTDPTERDIYFEQVYAINDRTKKWTDTKGGGMLVAAGEISTIEFFQ
jgi:hypothetical protein